MSSISPLGKRLFEEDSESISSPAKKPRLDDLSPSKKIVTASKKLFSSYSSPVKGSPLSGFNRLTSSTNSPLVHPPRKVVKKADSKVSKKLFADDNEIPVTSSVENIVIKTAKRSLEESAPSLPPTPLKKPRLDMENSYIPFHLRKQQQQKTPSLTIRDFNPLDPSFGKIAEIPGIPGYFFIQSIGKPGIDRSAYAFTENKKITIDASNPYFLKVIPGEYDSNQYVIKPFIPSKNVKEREAEIKREIARYDYPENCDLSFRPKIIFYGLDGTICQERGISLEEASEQNPNAFQLAIAEARTRMQENVQAGKTIVNDNKPGNFMFSVIDGRVMHVDIGSSCSENGFKKDLVKDLMEWINYGHPTHAEKAARWAYLTENFSEELIKECETKIREIGSPVKV